MDASYRQTTGWLGLLVMDMMSNALHMVHTYMVGMQAGRQGTRLCVELSCIARGCLVWRLGLVRLGLMTDAKCTQGGHGFKG